MPNPNPARKVKNREWIRKAAAELHRAECLCDEEEDIECRCEDCEFEIDRIAEVISDYAFPVRVRVESYMDLAVRSLAESGQPTSIVALLNRVREKRRNPNITRTSIETTLLRHVASKGDQSRIVKIRPGVYALRNWTNAAVAGEREAEAVGTSPCGQATP